jgi:hypothetical protein
LDLPAGVHIPQHNRPVRPGQTRPTASRPSIAADASDRAAATATTKVQGVHNLRHALVYGRLA